ncbi:MAG: right-handed parallel beta-helix repeat-containing protein [Gemmatimonadetes bacterium]|nr:right-handed parallel beta-helix repeat-containing protein [Gemmatimonadota bacterium]
MKVLRTLAVACLVTAVGIFELQNTATAAPPPGPPPGGGGGGDVVSVDCAMGTIQAAVDDAVGSTTIFITGTCVEDVTLTKDDITLSGNEAGDSCNKASPGGTGTIEGTITVDGVRAKIEHLVITGNGTGVVVTNRADARLTCNDISNNDKSGVAVNQTSNAVLTDNTLSSNGQRSFASPFIFFDVGLFLRGASSVQSNGNTYTDNQYAAIESDVQSTFRNGSFLPRINGHPPIPAEKDVIIQKGGDPANPATCKTNSGGPIAVVTFNNGHAEFRNADICGEIESTVNSTIRIDDAGGEIIGNVSATLSSFVRIRDRSGFGDGRLTTFDGTLTCSGGSQTFSSDVQCGQTCSGAIPGSCPAVPQSAANAVLRIELTGVGLSAASVDFLAPSDAIAAGAP